VHQFGKNKKDFDNIKMHGTTMKKNETECVYCAVRIETLNITRVNLRL
jgi:hypothetical protein